MAARRLPKSSTRESRSSMGGSRREAILFKTSSVATEKTINKINFNNYFLASNSHNYKSCDSAGCARECALSCIIDREVFYPHIYFFTNNNNNIIPQDCMCVTS